MQTLPCIPLLGAEIASSAVPRSASADWGKVRSHVEQEYGQAPAYMRQERRGSGLSTSSKQDNRPSWDRDATQKAGLGEAAIELGLSRGANYW